MTHDQIESSWLEIHTDNEDAVLVIAGGGIAAGHALDLWATVEEAVELAAGRLVAVDLHGVTTFDVESVDALVRLAKSSLRRDVNLCALLTPDAPLHEFLEASRPAAATLPIYPSLSAALTAVERHPA